MSFKKLFLGTSAMALFAGTALADGGPAPEPPPPPPPPPEEAPYTPPPAPAAAPRIWYAALHGGVVWLGDIAFDSFGDPYNTEMDNGWAAGGALGYRYGSGFRAEFEGSWRDNDGEVAFIDPELGLVFEGAEISALNLMLNGIYDFDLGGGFAPYLGGGIGAAHVSMDLFDVSGEEEDDGWAFAYQFIGGLSFGMPNTAMEVFADYRYMATAGLELFDEDVQDHDEYESHTVLGGLRFNF